jgi:hypothetical protein
MKVRIALGLAITFGWHYPSRRAPDDLVGEKKAVAQTMLAIIIGVGLLCFFLTAVGPAEAQVQQPSPQDLFLGPVTVTQPVQGVPVNIVSSAHLSLHTEADGLYLKAGVIADLNDLQAKIGAIVDTIQLPRENCRSFSANNPVVTIWGKELKAEASAATLWLHGAVDVWDCRENPVPNSKVEWRIENIGLGVKTKVPVVVTWPGSPIKNKLLTQPFDISEPLNFVRVNDSTVALELGDPNVQLGGQYVAVTKGLLSIAGINVNEKARDALRQAIDPTKLQASIPDEYLKLNPKIEAASFEANGSILLATMILSARVPAEQINETIIELVNQLQKKKM